MRATGNNEKMMSSLGVNTSSMKIAGLALANGLTAVSGFFICQVQGFGDIGMGIGIVILGLGSVMIGEIFLKTLKKNSITINILAVIVGTFSSNEISVYLISTMPVSISCVWA